MPKAQTPTETGYVHEPLHPAFKGKADVLAWTAHTNRNLDGPKFSVDLDAGTCTCKNGAAEQWHLKNREWVSNQYCSHKLRALADIVETHGRDPDMTFAYTKALASRYNVWEVVSAFHKELRLGNVERAVFWGSVLCTFRGIKGVYRYLLNILYEEGRDHALGLWLVGEITGKRMDYAGMCRAIALFCASPKKWNMPHRLPFLEAEMRGYGMLVKDYGRDVAKGGNIIAGDQKTKLIKRMLDGLKSKKLDAFQYGLKGLQKMVVANIDQHRAEICNMLIEASSPLTKKRPGYKSLESLISARASNGLGIGYHELNALADFLAGEPGKPGQTTSEALAAVLAAPAPPLRLAVTPTIPIYAQDNHTWAGKALLRRFPNEWQAGVKQEHMDLRLCGAYIGVNWRHLAVKQFGTIDAEWHTVKWPDWQFKTVADLWY